MKAFEGVLLCTDLDGTLLRAGGGISEENLRAIEHFKAEGGTFTFVTGRMPYFVRRIWETVRPNAPFCCINGGGIYDPRTGEYLWRRELPRTALDLLEEVDRAVEGIGIQINTFDRIYFCRENAAMERFRRVTGVPNLTCSPREVSEPIGKIVFGDHREEAILRVQELLLSHPRAQEFDFIRSDRVLYEILPRGNSKGAVLLQLAELLGMDPRRTVAVGDYYNDVEMLRAARLGIAVANACPDALAAADHVTVSNEEHAIARVIEDLERGRLTL